MDPHCLKNIQEPRRSWSRHFPGLTGWNGNSRKFSHLFLITKMNCLRLHFLKDTIAQNISIQNVSILFVVCIHLFQQVMIPESIVISQLLLQVSWTSPTIHQLLRCRKIFLNPQVWLESWNTILGAMVGFGIPALMVVWPWPGVGHGKFEAPGTPLIF